MVLDKRVLEVINYISVNFLKKVNDKSSERFDSEELIESLMKMGYKLFEINQAFELIFSLPDIITPEEVQGEIHDDYKATRVLSYEEKFKLTLDAQGFLFRSRELGLITDEEFEEILICVLRSDFREVGLGELKWIVNRIISDSERLMMINSTSGMNKSIILN